MSQPDTIALLGINNCLQIIETGVRWVVLCLSQDGAYTDSFENFRDNSLKGGLSVDITLNPPLFSLVNTFKSFAKHWNNSRWFNCSRNRNKTKKYKNVVTSWQPNYQCSGSMTFWCGSGSTDPCLWLMDPTIFGIDLQDDNKKQI